MTELLAQVERRRTSPAHGAEWRPTRYVRIDADRNRATVYYADLTTGIRRPQDTLALYDAADIEYQITAWLLKGERLVPGWSHAATIRYYELRCDDQSHRMLGESRCGYSFEQFIRRLRVCRTLGHFQPRLVSVPGSCGHPDLSANDLK